jgi:glycosyltransferase involved in cell wall biosynthesis
VGAAEGNPMISVIVPVHNGGATLERCLDGIFSSSYANYECIVVDDGSTDDAMERVGSFPARIVRLADRKGASYARNRGAEAAMGQILLFVDADVIVGCDCLEMVAKCFETHKGISAVFGSYDDEPGAENFLSQYRNLLHHFIHQTSSEEASTFWSGCGAVKREKAFIEAGMFDEESRMMEDIALGYKLKAAGHRIRLEKGLLGKHLKRYTLWSLVKLDIFDRAVPWTVLMWSTKRFTSDLNLKWNHKLSALIGVLLLAAIGMAPVSTAMMTLVPVLMGIYLFLNRDLYGFYLQKRGVRFTLKVVPVHFIYYVCSLLGLLIGTTQYVLKRRG